MTTLHIGKVPLVSQSLKGNFYKDKYFSYHQTHTMNAICLAVSFFNSFESVNDPGQAVGKASRLGQ